MCHGTVFTHESFVAGFCSNVGSCRWAWAMRWSPSSGTWQERHPNKPKLKYVVFKRQNHQIRYTVEKHCWWLICNAGKRSTPESDRRFLSRENRSRWNSYLQDVGEQNKGRWRHHGVCMVSLLLQLPVLCITCCTVREVCFLCFLEIFQFVSHYQSSESLSRARHWF